MDSVKWLFGYIERVLRKERITNGNKDYAVTTVNEIVSKLLGSPD